MDGSTPARAHRWVEGLPVVLPDGTETIAHCAHCGGGMIPADYRSAYCSDPCRAAAKAASPARKVGDARRSARGYAAHQSYRMARRALRLAGMDPSAADVLKGRGVVEEWRTLVGLPPPRRGVKRAPAPRAPWGAAVGPQPEHVARGLELAGLPATAAARHVHGLVAHLVGEAHDRHVARWALAMPAGAQGRSGWGVVLFRPNDASRLAGLARGVMVGSARADLRIGPVVRLRAPAPLAPGRYRVTIDAVTPVSHMIAGRTRPVTQPSVDTMLRCAGDLLQRLGLSTGRMHVASVACASHPERVVIGGHVGPITGWVGRVTVECNAPAAWALGLARHAGLGGRVAYGLGRVRVEVVRVGDA